MFVEDFMTVHLGSTQRLIAAPYKREGVTVGSSDATSNRPVNGCITTRSLICFPLPAVHSCRFDDERDLETRWAPTLYKAGLVVNRDLPFRTGRTCLVRA